MISPAELMGILHIYNLRSDHLSPKKKLTAPTKTQLSNFLGTPGEDYFKGNPKSLNFYFLVIWWGKLSFFFSKLTLPETNSKFAPENHWLEYEVSFLG